MATDAVERVHVLPQLAARPPESNKGSFGRVLVIAGSRGMSGAAVLAGSAALRAGAGLVTVACPEPVWNQVAVGNVCYTTRPLPANAAGHFAQTALHELVALAEKNDVVALGPGLGQSADVTALVAGLFTQTARPMVVDADGLNALQGQIETLASRQTPLILTPHPGEFGRLIGQPPGAVQARREELAVAFAQAHRVVLVLKGQGTLVTDGRRLYRNDTGNPGMATGGTGDVLTGTIAGLLGQGLALFEAAQLGVHVHGRAGDLARAELGEVSLIATDLLHYLPRAFRAN